MKKILYIFALVSLVFTSCEDPLEDTYAELDADPSNETPILGDEIYTLTDSDYDDLDLNFGNFSSVDQAKELLPAFLTNNFSPAWDNGSLVNVIFKLYNPLILDEYTVTDADYDELVENGEINQPHLSTIDDINSFFEFKFPQLQTGNFVRLTYQVKAERIEYELTEDDYDSVGNGQFDNFDVRPGRDEEDIAVRVEKISTILNSNFSDLPIGQRFLVAYKVFNGSVEDEEIELRYNGTDYEIPLAGYELVGGDYDAIVTELAATYPDPTGSMERFGNFERRSDSDAYWSDEMIVEALNIVLNNLNPTASEGVQYSVTYSIYNGSPGEETKILELQGDAYVELTDIEEELVLKSETKLYALTSNDWEEPFTFEPDDYTAMGQRFPNFSNDETAFRNIAIFLGLEFPFAEEGDVVPVAYDFFVSGEGVGERYANFAFENGAFSVVPNVIDSSLQFGLENGEWVPDNTINYALTGADVDIIVAGLTGRDGFADAVDNVDTFGSFERRPTDNEFWSDDMLLEAFKILFNNINPNAEEGQKYNVTITTYTGSVGEESFNLIKEGGDWIYQAN